MSTFYNVRKSLIQAFRILFAAMLFVVAIGTVCPDIARAENLPESTQINEFAQSDEARTQTLALMEAVQNDGSPEASTQIAIGYAISDWEEKGKKTLFNFTNNEWNEFRKQIKQF